MALKDKDAEKRVAHFVERCRRLGIRVTHQRLEVFRELAGSEDHPSADCVFRSVRRRVPTVSLDTIYRTLNMLAEEGVIARVGALSDRARFDGNADRHHHFVCTKCGLIRDLYCRDFDDLSPPQGVSSMGKVKSIHVEIRGVCSSCASKTKRKG